MECSACRQVSQSWCGRWSKVRSPSKANTWGRAGLQRAPGPRDEFVPTTHVWVGRSHGYRLILWDPSACAMPYTLCPIRKSLHTSRCSQYRPTISPGLMFFELRRHTPGTDLISTKGPTFFGPRPRAFRDFRSDCGSPCFQHRQRSENSGLCPSQTISSMLYDVIWTPGACYGQSLTVSTTRVSCPHVPCVASSCSGHCTALCECRQSDATKSLACAVPRTTAKGNMIPYLGSVWSRAEQAL